ncbi:DUF4129 domain-containing protein [Rathayibacter sp. KR2-224]|uniref:DUF4129 domain-containing protein n=1 Tax=Rathayibacter sp. KR2-224 TaxID=3400913 RepID=UPI003C05C04F
MDKGGDARRRSTVGLVVTVAVLGLALVVGTMVSGPLRAGSPLWLPTAGRGIPRPALPGPVQTATPAPLPQEHFSPAQLQQWLLWAALVAVVAAGILVYLLRRLLRRSRLLSEERDGAMSAVGATAPPARTDDPVAPVMASGIAKAIRLLDEAREPHDAIVRAWLGLQEAAQASGAGRRPAETPGEYTARIVARFGTDRDAARTLLDLYQGVRFGGHPADRNTVDLARSCLARLRDSWHDEAAQRTDQGSTR